MQSIDVSVNVTDDLSGLRWVFFYVHDPTNTGVDPLFSALAGGGSTSNTYMKTIEIPLGSAEGTWKIGVFLRDRAGNWIRYGVNGTDPFPVPGDEEFTVSPLASTTFGNFVATFGLTGPDALPGADPDHDLFENALELLLGLDPTVPNAADPVRYEITHTAGELQLLFTIDPTLTVGINGDFLEVSDGPSGYVRLGFPTP